MHATDLIRAALLASTVVLASAAACGDTGGAARVGQAADVVDDDAAIADAADEDAEADGSGGVAADVALDAGADDPDATVGELDAGDSDGTSVDAEDDGSGFDGDPLEPWPDLEPGPVDALVACTTSPTVCDAGPVAGGLLWASYRKDYSLPRSTYPEYTDIPDDGGRFHIVGVAATSGAVTGAFVDDVALSDAVLPPSPSMEWYHVWPDPVVEGAPVWVAFHSRRADWDERASARVRLETAGGSRWTARSTTTQRRRP